jgi:shikimate 5-dehydrogenase
MQLALQTKAAVQGSGGMASGISYCEFVELIARVAVEVRDHSKLHAVRCVCLSTTCYIAAASSLRCCT